MSSVAFDLFQLPCVRSALSILLGDYWGARMLHESLEFPTPLEGLRRSEIPDPVLKSLIDGGYVECRAAGDASPVQRDLTGEGPPAWGPDAGFVLTEAGEARALELIFAVRCRPSGVPAGGRPAWDDKDKQLWFEGRCVLRLQRWASYQKLLLDTLEEDGWPREWVDDPLPGDGQLDPEDRLRSTIKSLNHRLPACGLRFQVRSDGLAYRWLVRAPAKRRPQGDRADAQPGRRAVG